MLLPVAWLPQLPETIVILIVGLLIFGKRLPDVARSIGKSIIEFKKGMRGVEDESDRLAEQPAAQALPPRAAPPAAVPRAEVKSLPAESAGAGEAPKAS